jgi:hypothetical protein
MFRMMLDLEGRIQGAAIFGANVDRRTMESGCSERNLMRHAFAANFESGEPPVVTVKHRGRLLGVKLDGGRPDLTFFRNYFTTVALGDDHPRVVGANASSSPGPAQTAFGNEFVNLAIDGKAECLPGEDAAILEPAGLGALDLDVG